MFLIRLLMGPIALLISYSTAQFLKPPEIVLQASSLGGFRAFIPEVCGIEKFNFEWRREPEEEWRGGLIPGPIGGFWTYEDPAAALGFGDTLFYRAMIRLDGRGYRKPETPWLVTEVFEEFPPYPPPPPPPQGGCKKKGNETEIEDLGTSTSSMTSTTSTTSTTTTVKPTTASSTTVKPTTASSTTVKPTIASNTTESSLTTDAPEDKTTTTAEETTVNPKDMVERIGTNKDSDPDEDKNKPKEEPTKVKEEPTKIKEDPAIIKEDPTKVKEEPTKIKDDPTKVKESSTKPPDQAGANQIPDVIAKGVCQRPWLLEPSPFDTRTAFLEKQSLRMQCEMAAYSNRYVKIIEDLNDELTELKKLNYAMVTRMQRLETILRSIPQPIGWM